jgi:hypothetical protein
MGNLETFGEKVFEDLWQAICERFPEEETPTDQILLERTFHQALVEEKTRKFIGRKDLLDQLTQFVNGIKGKLMVVTGNAGEGKTALLASFAKNYAATTTDTFVLPHFIGASPQSNDIHWTLERICKELALVFEIDDSIPTDFKELARKFPAFLEQAAFKGTFCVCSFFVKFKCSSLSLSLSLTHTERVCFLYGVGFDDNSFVSVCDTKIGKYVLIIDALDQLNDKIHQAQSLDWFPEDFPCKVIVSVTEGTKPYEILVKKRNVLKMTELKMTLLSLNERTEIVRQTLWQYHKKLVCFISSFDLSCLNSLY